MLPEKAVIVKVRYKCCFIRTVLQKPGKKRVLSQTKKLLIGRQTLTAEFSQSHLTGLLNRQDRLVSSRNVLSSRGEVIRLAAQQKDNDFIKAGPAWHRGETVVKTAAGKQTITHLQSLTLPSTSHYFDRKLSDQETASIIANQIKSHKLPGYVGSISPAEKLALSWAATKRAMILTRLHWPLSPKMPPGRLLAAARR